LALNQGPFPRPELPGVNGTTGLSATPGGPACPSRASGWGSRALTAWGFPCCVDLLVPTCRRHYPGGPLGSDRSWDGLFHPFPLHPQRRRPSPYWSKVGDHIGLFEACSTFTRVSACRLAASP